MRATRLIHLILYDLIALIIFGEEYKLFSPSCCYFELFSSICWIEHVTAVKKRCINSSFYKVMRSFNRSSRENSTDSMEQSPY